jgi:hypothetical protein
VHDDLTNVLDDASWVGDKTADGDVVTRSGNHLT